MFKYEKSKEIGFNLLYEFNFNGIIKEYHMILATKFEGIDELVI